MSSKVISWRALEHKHTEKSADWFWIIGVITITGAILSLYFNNILLAILITIAGFTSFLHGHTQPKILEFKITRKGIQAGSSVFTYSALESFWVIDEEINDRVILKSKKFLMPYIILPFDSTKTDPDEIRDYLLEYLNEEELQEPLSQLIMERLGF